MRTAFLVDGFNLYHSLADASAQMGGRGTKWLNLKTFCAAYLAPIGGGASLGPVHYFSALAKHIEARKPDVTRRHKTYIRCLEDSGVIVELGHFKEKWIDCTRCGRQMTKYEEKETDVAIGVRLLELLWRNQCDAAVIVSADSDLSPAIRTVKRLFPRCPVYCVLPFNRASFDLKLLSDRCFKATRQAYARSQFPDPYVCDDGTAVQKPLAW